MAPLVNPLILVTISAIIMQMPSEIPGIQYGAMGLLGLSMIIFSLFLSKAWKDLIFIITKTADNEKVLTTAIVELKDNIKALSEEVKDWRKN